jgi:hypothetical protein
MKKRLTATEKVPVPICRKSLQKKGRCMKIRLTATGKLYEEKLIATGKVYEEKVDRNRKGM